jgi:phenylalanyl-tRNA synthetase alpha chain
MKKELDTIVKQCTKQLASVHSREDLDACEQSFFSRKQGTFGALAKKMAQLSNDERREFGKFLNAAKDNMRHAFEQKRDEISRKEMGDLGEKESTDITQPLLPVREFGHVHPITQIRWELEDIAQAMGFLVEDGPELESDYYNFGSLNFPDDHPARESMDTFYIKDQPGQLMRAHVSNMQVRLMRKYGAPLRAAKPGRVFRNEAIDATHAHTFYQFDCIVVDKNLSIGDLIGTIKTLLEGVYKTELNLRLRPAHFPFVEPGFEMDMEITYKAGDVIKTKWIEIVGCGMVHPNVLKEGNVDPETHNGYAFSFGLDRLVISRFGIEDIRHFHSGDLRFLQQF